MTSLFAKQRQELRAAREREAAATKSVGTAATPTSPEAPVATPVGRAPDATAAATAAASSMPFASRSSPPRTMPPDVRRRVAHDDLVHRAAEATGGPGTSVISDVRERYGSTKPGSLHTGTMSRGVADGFPRAEKLEARVLAGKPMHGGTTRPIIVLPDLSEVTDDVLDARTICFDMHGNVDYRETPSMLDQQNLFFNGAQTLGDAQTFTVAELSYLLRSRYSAQRALCLKVLLCVVRRLKAERYSPDVIKQLGIDLERSQTILSLRNCLDDANRTVLALSLELLVCCVTPPSARRVDDRTARLWALGNRGHLQLAESVLANAPTVNIDADVSLADIMDSLHANICAGLLQTHLMNRLEYLVSQFTNGEDEFCNMMHALVLFCQQSPRFCDIVSHRQGLLTRAIECLPFAASVPPQTKRYCLQLLQLQCQSAKDLGAALLSPVWGVIGEISSFGKTLGLILRSDASEVEMLTVAEMLRLVMVLAQQQHELYLEQWDFVGLASKARGLVESSPNSAILLEVTTYLVKITSLANKQQKIGKGEVPELQIILLQLLEKVLSVRPGPSHFTLALLSSVSTCLEGLKPAGRRVRDQLAKPDPLLLFIQRVLQELQTSAPLPPSPHRASPLGHPSLLSSERVRRLVHRSIACNAIESSFRFLTAFYETVERRSAIWKQSVDLVFQRIGNNLATWSDRDCLFGCGVADLRCYLVEAVLSEALPTSVPAELIAKNILLYLCEGLFPLASTVKAFLDHLAAFAGGLPFPLLRYYNGVITSAIPPSAAVAFFFPEDDAFDRQAEVQSKWLLEPLLCADALDEASLISALSFVARMYRLLQEANDDGREGGTVAPALPQGLAPELAVYALGVVLRHSAVIHDPAGQLAFGEALQLFLAAPGPTAAEGGGGDSQDAGDSLSFFAAPRLDTARVSPSFYSLYADLVAEFASASFLNPAFARFLSIPLAMPYPPKYRQCFWSTLLDAADAYADPGDGVAEDGDGEDDSPPPPSRFPRLRTNQLPAPLACFVEPTETDEDVLALYVRCVGLAQRRRRRWRQRRQERRRRRQRQRQAPEEGEEEEEEEEAEDADDDDGGAFETIARRQLVRYAASTHLHETNRRFASAVLAGLAEMGVAVGR
ncbi:hypothetical protein DFJ73DRAFT_468612 [Zopfochytrium polystomum]|nr:hypothetical protein DFJ73DRAFT_468612 [Zopfochytrium polystomum]